MATNSANTSTSLTGNGSAGPFSISFSYIEEADVDVFVAGVLKTKPTHYTFTSATQITFTSGNEPANGAVILIKRDTGVGTAQVDFQDGSVLTETDLDTNTKQLLFGLQELTDDYVKRNGTQTITGSLVFEGATDDANETTLAVTDPTADRTITLPDITGTVITSGDTGTVSSTMITNGTIVDADVNASAAISGSKLQAASGSNAGSMSSSDKTKLDGVETAATADQTDAEIRAAVEAASDSNVFTDADHTKLNGIEASATADQTNAEIKTAYEANSNTNAFTDAEKTKLSGIAANADVTSTKQIGDLSNVNTTGVADGKILKYQSSSGNFIIADDGGGGGASLTNGDKGDITVASAGTVSESFTIDSGDVTGAKIANQTITSANLAANSVLGVHIDTQNITTAKIADSNVTSAKIAGQAVTKDKLNLISTSSAPGLEVKGDGSSQDGYLQLNCSQNSHGVKIKAPPHSAAQSYTLTLPSSIVNRQFLKTDASGNLSWAAVDLTALNATNLTSGTVPDARFPATLPAASAANLTAIPAANITGTLPAISATNLTNVPAANITGTLPAIDGSNLTGITAGAQGGGGESIFFESENTMNNSYTVSTNHNALVAGPLPIASGATLTVNSPSVVTIP